jgi:transposase-like protein
LDFLIQGLDDDPRPAACTLRRVVDAEGEVLDVLVQSKRDKRAAVKLMRRLLKKYAIVPSGWSRTI